MTIKIKTSGPCCITIEGEAEVMMTPPPSEPAPGGWIGVDPHCHAHGCPEEHSARELALMAKDVGLSVAIPLAWGLGKGYSEDLGSLTGDDDPAGAGAGVILHYDAEYSQTPSAVLGHLVTHGVPANKLLVPYQGKPSASTIPIAKWAREQGALSIGMAHAQTWPAYPPPSGGPEYPCTTKVVQPTPYEAPILAVLGLIDYISVESQNPGDDRCIHPGAALLWGHLQSAGFPVALIGGSDYSCISKSLGTMRTMVFADGAPSYPHALGEINRGAAVVSSGRNGVLEMRWQVFEEDGKVDLILVISTDQQGPVELLLDGNAWTTLPIIDGKATFKATLSKSCWIVARTPDYHTNALRIVVGGKKQRAQESIAWLLGWVEQLMGVVARGVFGEGAWEALPYYSEAREILRGWGQ